MVDFAQVKQQIDAMLRERAVSREEFAHKLDEALRQVNRWKEDWASLQAKAAKSKTSWLLAGLTGNPTTTFELPKRPKMLTVIASDGSQIFPDRHEVSSCYLINIGSVALHYGVQERPRLQNRPHLFFRQEDLYQDWGGRKTWVSEEMVAMRRHVMEVEELVNLARLTLDKVSVPSVALFDGTLILWTLEGKPEDYRQWVLSLFLGCLEWFRSAGIPIAGYISSPKSTDVVNTLRLGLCPYEFADCDHCEWGLKSQPLPCGVIEGVTDSLLYCRLLKAGERSSVFASASRILDAYGEHEVEFFYLNVAEARMEPQDSLQSTSASQRRQDSAQFREIARIEIPHWVSQDLSMLDLVHAAVYDQALKGRGYPVSLAEAHERALVRGVERETFYRLVEEAQVRAGMQVRISQKAAAKRAPGV